MDIVPVLVDLDMLLKFRFKIHVSIFMIRNISFYFFSIFKVNITIKSRNLSTAKYYKYSHFNMRNNISYFNILGLVLRKSGRTHPWSLVKQERSVVRISDILSKVIITSLGSIKMITKRKVKFWQSWLQGLKYSIQTLLLAMIVWQRVEVMSSRDACVWWW